MEASSVGTNITTVPSARDTLGPAAVVTAATAVTVVLGSGADRRGIAAIYVFACVLLVATVRWPRQWDLNGPRTVFWTALGVLLGKETISMSVAAYGPGHHVTTIAACTALTVVGAVTFARHVGLAGSWSIPRRVGVALGLLTICALVAASILPPPYEAPWGAVGPVAAMVLGLAVAGDTRLDSATPHGRWLTTPLGGGAVILGASLIYLQVLAISPYVTTAP